MARSPNPADGHHYASERPQREAAEQIHFRDTCVPRDVEPDTCVGVVASFRRSEAGVDVKLFDFPVDDAPDPLQMELVELQYNDGLKAKFYI